jgi:hypothetical protein
MEVDPTFTTRPLALSAKQERKLRDFLDERLLEINRAYKKRFVELLTSQRLTLTAVQVSAND